MKTEDMMNLEGFVRACLKFFDENRFLEDNIFMNNYVWHSLYVLLEMYAARYKIGVPQSVLIKIVGDVMADFAEQAQEENNE